jgi:hypothetical protein
VYGASLHFSCYYVHADTHGITSSKPINEIFGS